MAESWSLPNISFMAPQEAPRSALLQGAEADQGPGSTARRAADAPAIAIPSRGRERQLAPRRHAEPSHVSPRGSSTVHAMDPWILEPQTAGETRIFLESWPLSFLRAGPPKSRKKAGESRTHPNLETNFAKLTAGPTRGLTARCLRCVCLRCLFWVRCINDPVGCGTQPSPEEKRGVAALFSLTCGQLPFRLLPRAAAGERLKDGARSCARRSRDLAAASARLRGVEAEEGGLHRQQGVPTRLQAVAHLQDARSGVLGQAATGA